MLADMGCYKIKTSAIDIAEDKKKNHMKQIKAFTHNGCLF